MQLIPPFSEKVAPVSKNPPPFWKMAIFGKNPKKVEKMPKFFNFLENLGGLTKSRIFSKILSLIYLIFIFNLCYALMILLYLEEALLVGTVLQVIA